MTENEAIEMLKIQRSFTNGANAKVQAIDVAIQALKEVQAYRAIGTVEELQQLKEYIDTINEICSGYSAIGTIEECRVAVERMKPRKPYIKSSEHNFKGYYCPCCNGYIRSIHTNMEIILEEDASCGRCGQKLDWSE